ncbi:MAG TPA: hypothetical protein VL069_03690, partial [Opitutus sp.]|nr:hypothetical protein [Opitutus sp.]
MTEMPAISGCADSAITGSPSVANRPPRVLVTIASYGLSHIQFLRQIIRTYQCLPMDVRIVVLSDAPKDLDPNVEVIVGLPSSNPWTLPFAHKAVFAERADLFDLFIYSEDDIGASEANIRAFLDAAPQLATDEIAGFLRYEVAADGTCFL